MRKTPVDETAQNFSIRLRGLFNNSCGIRLTCMGSSDRSTGKNSFSERRVSSGLEVSVELESLWMLEVGLDQSLWESEVGLNYG